jgi:hypothetical protein
VLDHYGTAGQPIYEPLDSNSLLALLTEHMRFFYSEDRESPPPLFVLSYILGLKQRYDDITPRLDLSQHSVANAMLQVH